MLVSSVIISARADQTLAVIVLNTNTNTSFQCTTNGGTGDDGDFLYDSAAMDFLRIGIIEFSCDFEGNLVGIGSADDSFYIKTIAIYGEERTIAT